MSLAILSILLGAAVLEVAGDAVVRLGLTRGSSLIIVAGMIVLGLYGVLVNTVKWDFSKLLGVYVAVFAVVSVLFGRFIFNEQISWSMWVGLAFILIGAAFIQS